MKWVQGSVVLYVLPVIFGTCVMFCVMPVFLPVFFVINRLSSPVPLYLCISTLPLLLLPCQIVPTVFKPPCVICLFCFHYLTKLNSCTLNFV